MQQLDRYVATLCFEDLWIQRPTAVHQAHAPLADQAKDAVTTKGCEGLAQIRSSSFF